MAGLWEVYAYLVSLRAAEVALEYALSRFWHQQRDLERFLLYASQIFEDYLSLRAYEYEYSKTRWRFRSLGADPTFVVPSRDQLLACDVLLLDAEGDVYLIRDLLMPTGERYSRERFLKRLAAEYNERRKKLGKEPLDFATSKVASYIVNINWYVVTIQPRAGA